MKKKIIWQDTGRTVPGTKTPSVNLHVIGYTGMTGHLDLSNDDNDKQSGSQPCDHRYMYDDNNESYICKLCGIISK